MSLEMAIFEQDGFKISLPEHLLLGSRVDAITVSGRLQEGALLITAHYKIGNQNKSFSMPDLYRVDSSELHNYFSMSDAGVPVAVISKKIRELEKRIGVCCNDLISAYRLSIKDMVGKTFVFKQTGDLSLDYDRWFDDIDEKVVSIAKNKIIPLFENSISEMKPVHSNKWDYLSEPLLVTRSNDNKVLVVKLGDVSFQADFSILTSFGMGHVFNENMYLLHRCVELARRNLSRKRAPKLKVARLPIETMSTFALLSLRYIVDAIQSHIFTTSRDDALINKFNFEDIEEMRLVKSTDGFIGVEFPKLVQSGDIARMWQNTNVTMYNHEMGIVELSDVDVRLWDDGAVSYWSLFETGNSLSDVFNLLTSEIEQRSQYDGIGFRDGIFDNVLGVDEN